MRWRFLSACNGGQKSGFSGMPTNKKKETPFSYGKSTYRRRHGEDLPTQAGSNDIRGVVRVAAERSRISQWPDHFVKIPKRPRPAVAKDDRYGIRTVAGFVNKVDQDVLNSGLIMGKGIHLPLVVAPVVFVDPVIHEFFEVGEVRAVLPVGISEVRCPTGLHKTVAQVCQGFFGNGDGEGIGIEITRHIHLAVNGFVKPPSKPDGRLSPHPAFPSRLSSQTLLSCTVLRTRLPLKAGAYCTHQPYGISRWLPR